MGLDCFMMKIKKLISVCFYVAYLGLLTTCQPSAKEPVQEQEETKPPIDKDELIVRLSMLMNGGSDEAEQEINTLINYAIDHLYDVQLAPSGLLYEIIEKGDGAPIAWGDFLSAHYKGFFLNGKVFADSRQQGQPLDFYVGNMIDAWNEGLQLINVGGKIRLLVPSNLGYGEDGLKTTKGTVLVPGNELLIFEVAVLEKRK